MTISNINIIKIDEFHKNNNNNIDRKDIEDDDKNEVDKDWPQIIAILSACLCAITAGMLFAWTSPSIPKIINDNINYNITLDDASYFTVLPPIGQILSSLIFSKLTDIIGRKHTLLLISIPHITGWILLATAKSIYVFYVARFIIGFGDACIFAALPMYVGEIATPKVRGSWGNAMTFGIYIGQLLINIIGSYNSIQTTAYIGLIIPITFLITFIFMPESPYFYLMKEREEDARRSLQRLRRRHNVDIELAKLKADVQRQMSESGNWIDLITIPSNRKAIYAGVFLRASQQLGGISTFAVYTQYIFIKAGGNVSATISTIIFSALCTILNFFAAFTLDKFGRRKSYFYSCLLCGLILFTMSAYFFTDQFYTNLNLNSFKWIPITGMVSFVTCYSFGLGIIPTLMLGELFSANIKGKGLCLLNIIFACLVCLITKLFHVLESNIGLFSPFLIYSVSCLISSILSLYFVPETKGKTLEEIQQSLKNKSKINNSSN